VAISTEPIDNWIKILLIERWITKNRCCCPGREYVATVKDKDLGIGAALIATSDQSVI
jgi:hypothetical protein